MFKHKLLMMLAALGLMASACAAPAPNVPATAVPATVAPTEAPPTLAPTTAAFLPVTIDNCGVSQTFTAPPQHAVSMNQHATEIMLALGLQDHMIGTAYLDDTILPEFATAYKAIPVLATEYPSREVFLNAKPDFVYGGFASAFSDEEGIGTRDSLQQLGIGTYLTSSYCAKGIPFTMDDVYTDIRNIGAIFGVSDKAEAEVTKLKADLDSVKAAVGDTTTKTPMLLFDSMDDKAPFVGAGTGVSNFIIQTVGGANVYGNVQGNWADGSWEEIIAGAPEVIILNDASWSTAKEKEDLLVQDATLASVPAVVNKKFISLPFTATTPGIRVPWGILQVAQALYPDKIKP